MKISIAILNRLWQFSTLKARPSKDRHITNDLGLLYAYYDALEASQDYLDLDKYWSAIHFLLTGEWPFDENSNPTLLHQAILGGTETQWDATYGKVRYFTVAEVRNISEAFTRIQRDELQLHMDELGITANEYVVELYERLVAFFQEAARQGEIILISFN